MTKDRFYQKPYIRKYEMHIRWDNYNNIYRMNHFFSHAHMIIDSQGELNTIVAQDYHGYLLEKYNAWDESTDNFFVCHNSNGHFQIVDSSQSNPAENKWKTHVIPKKETAIQLCRLLNELYDDEGERRHLFKKNKELKKENKMLKEYIEHYEQWFRNKKIKNIIVKNRRVVL